jgi:hypothetical protein
MPNWPIYDLICWVEWRVRAFEVSRENEKKGWAHEQPDHPLSELDMRMWLTHVRDKRSLAQIAFEQYPREWNESKGKRGNQRTISRVRRAVGRVEAFLNRSGSDFAYPKAWRQQLAWTLEDLMIR